MIKIIEDGMEFVMENYNGSKQDCCEKCSIGQKECHSDFVLYRMCRGTSLICTSAQKVTDEAKVYHSANREEARGMVGKVFNKWAGGEWGFGVLEQVSIDPIDMGPFLCGGMWVSVIKEAPTRHLTWDQIKALHPDLEDVVLIEEKDND